MSTPVDQPQVCNHQPHHDGPEPVATAAASGIMPMIPLSPRRTQKGRTADPAAVTIAELRHALRTLLAVVRLADIDAAGCDVEQYDAAISAAAAALANAESFAARYRPI